MNAPLIDGHYGDVWLTTADLARLDLDRPLPHNLDGAIGFRWSLGGEQCVAHAIEAARWAMRREVGDQLRALVLWLGDTVHVECHQCDRETMA